MGLSGQLALTQDCAPLGGAPAMAPPPARLQMGSMLYMNRGLRATTAARWEDKLHA